METKHLKKYAPGARRDFIEAVTSKAAVHGLMPDGKILPMQEEGDVVIIGERPFPRSVAKQRKEMETRIRKEGFPQFIEAVAYTWFNRFVAIRYMELHGYLNHGYRVLSHPAGTPIPEVMESAERLDLPGLDSNKVIDLKLDGRKDDELYRMVLVAQCNSLHSIMPFMFEKVDDGSELLLPDNLLHTDSLVRRMVEGLPKESLADVEAVGWLYQFYISEKKDDVFAALKKGKKITPENIPAATQLFTPHWIVRYLVENSLGRLWMLNHPDSRLIEQMDYYIRPEEPETDFLRISSPEEIKICDPACGSGHMLTYAFDLLYAIYEEQGYQASDIPRLILTHNLYGIEIDQRAGALAAFALTMKAREKYRRFLQSGKVVQPNICVLENVEIESHEYDAYLDDGDRGDPKSLLGFCREAVTNVFSGIEHNRACVPTVQQVLEHCDFTAQAFQFADVLLKNEKLFTQANRRRIRRNKSVRKRLFLALRSGNALSESRDPTLATFFRADFRKAATNGALLERSEAVDLLQLVSDFYLSLVNQFKEADNFGSLIRPLVTDVSEVLELLRERQMGEDLFLAGVHKKVLKVLRQADYLNPKYHVVVANPPYMGSKGMGKTLKNFANAMYPDAKSDLFAMFTQRMGHMMSAGGFMGLMTPFTWMFIRSYERFRIWMLDECSLTSLIRPEYHAFFDSAFVPICAFAAQKGAGTGNAKFIDLNDFYGEEEQPKKTLEAIANPDCGWLFEANTNEFRNIPGAPFAYQLTTVQLDVFRDCETLSKYADVREGLNTGDNEKFFRHWAEVSYTAINLDASTSDDAQESQLKWFPCNKGGSFRRWFGNNEYVIDWKDDGYNIRNFRNNDGKVLSAVRNSQFYFRKGLTWSGVGSSGFSVRHFGHGFVFNSVGRCLFPKHWHWYVLGYLNSTVSSYFLKILAPTLHFSVGDVANLPLREPSDSVAREAESVVQRLVKLAEDDWNRKEISREFQDIPLTECDGILEASFQAYHEDCGQRFAESTTLTQKLNQRYVTDYGLEGEIDCDVSEEAVSLSRPTDEDVAQMLVSYSVGCMLGRYSLDKPGLVLANQGETLADYLRRLYRRTQPLDSERAIAQPDQVVFIDNAKVACFRCGHESSVADARFVIIGEKNEDGAHFGRPNVYCPLCLKDARATDVTYQQPLEHFSLRQAASRKWCDREALKAFLERAGCFAHPITLEPDAVRFLPDDDNVLPMLDCDWFNDDISERFKKFLKVSFGTEHYDENLSFLENALYPENRTGRKRKTIRDYFLKEFYNHHIKLYKKRPIYWLISSGKQKAFQALIYMHRYNPSTLSRMRTEYVVKLQGIFNARIEQLESDIPAATSTSHRKTLERERGKLIIQREELQTFDEKLHHYADQRIELDLDDGVKVNYGKFGDLLAEVKAITGKKPKVEVSV